MSGRNHLTRREKIWIFMEDNPIINIFILLVIVFSTVCFVLETEYKQDDLASMWFGCAAHPRARECDAAAATA